MMKRRLTQWRTNRQSTMASSASLRPRKKLENTYRMAPTPSSKFNASRVEHEMEKTMAEMVPPSREYDSKLSADLTKQLTDEIKCRVKTLGFRRYKFVVQVIIAQVKDQGFAVTSRSVWDNSKDNFATAVHETPHYVIVATVFASYFE